MKFYQVPKTRTVQNTICYLPLLKMIFLLYAYLVITTIWNLRENLSSPFPQYSTIKSQKLQSIHFLNLVISPLSLSSVPSFTVVQPLYTLTSFLPPVSCESHSSDIHAPSKHTNGLPNKILQWLLIPYGRIHWEAYKI